MRFSVPISGWLLAGLGPFGLSGFCGTLVPGFRRFEGLPVAAGGCLGGFGAGSLRLLGWEAEQPQNMVLDYHHVNKSLSCMYSIVSFKYHSLSSVIYDFLLHNSR